MKKGKTKTYKLPKKRKVFLLKVGDENHEPTEEFIQRCLDRLSRAIKKGNNVIAFPYYVSLSTLDEPPKEVKLVKEKVFCKDCKWLNYDWDCKKDIATNHCEAPENCKSDFYAEDNIIEECSKVNKNNDCQQFKPIEGKGEQEELEQRELAAFRNGLVLGITLTIIIGIWILMAWGLI